jgi:hypothetical protein
VTDDASSRPSWIDRALGVAFIVLGFALAGAVAAAFFLLAFSSIGR